MGIHRPLLPLDDVGLFPVGHRVDGDDRVHSRRTWPNVHRAGVRLPLGFDALRDEQRWLSAGTERREKSEKPAVTGQEAVRSLPVGDLPEGARERAIVRPLRPQVVDGRS